MGSRARTGDGLERSSFGKRSEPPAEMRRSALSRLCEWALPSVLFGFLAVLNARRAFHEETTLRVAFSIGATLLWIGFFLAVQRRPPAVRRERSALSVGAALLSSFVTIPIGAAEHTRADGRLWPALVLLVAGSAFSLWSLAHLGRRFGVLADARGLVVSGPYRLVRHPLYLGELVNLLGLVVAADRWLLPLVSWLVLLGVQVIRSGYEEKVLTSAFDEYRSYAARVTHRIVPGLV